MAVLPDGTIINDLGQPTGQSVDLSKKEPVVISSLGTQRRVNNNMGILQNVQMELEKARALQEQVNVQLKQKGLPTVPLPQQTGQMGQQGVQSSTQTLQNISASPAASIITKEINESLQGGITGQQQASLEELKRKESEALANISAAQTASATKDYTTLNARMTAYQRSIKEYQDNLEKFHKETQTLRTRSLAALTPGEQERQVQTQLADVRQKADTFKLENEKAKYNEFRLAQGMEFAGGRAREIDIKSSFKNQEFALEEKNLLTRLGLLQSAREFESKTLAQQLDFIKDDFDLQTKIQDRLDKQEEDIFEEVDKYSANQKKTLFDLIKNFEGLGWDDLGGESQKQLTTLAEQSGLSVDLVSEALDVSKDRYTFENAVKLAKEKRAGEAEERAETRLGLAEEAATRSERMLQLAEGREKRLAGEDGKTRFSNTQINSGAATAGIPISDFQKLDQDTQNFFINNSDQIKSKKKFIDEAKTSKDDPMSIEKEISESSAPDAVKDSLVRYLWSVFPRPTNESLPWWKRIL